MKSDAVTVEDYLGELPEDRREAISVVRAMIRKNLPSGYEEAMNWGMIAYQVPLEMCPDTYNGQPLMYAALASQKHHMAVYLTAIYMNEADRDRFFEKYKATGKRLDIGKSCVRFRKLEDLPLDLIGHAVTSMPVDVFVAKAKALHSK
ncbi:iron chaperone [Candidatus Bipolaricaulota bacterium]